MEQARYTEMKRNVEHHFRGFSQRKLYLFGHCEATLALADLLMGKGASVRAILDNSLKKQGLSYKGISVSPPSAVMETSQDKSAVLIATRFYESMNAQLRGLGYGGEIVKLVDYNTYAEYSLSEETRERKEARLQRGRERLQEIIEKHKNAFLVFCPFNALGDVYFCMSYLPRFLAGRGKSEYAVCVPSDSCAAVARLFGAENVETLDQNDMDEAVQAVIYTKDQNCFIAHQDRPYVVNLHKALKAKRIPLEKAYCCGVFGLPVDTESAVPVNWKPYQDLKKIRKGRTVILSPYAKSVVPIPKKIWEEIVDCYKVKGYQVLTNVSSDELPLPGTEPLRAELSEMKSVLEYVGTFVGIRSGLCDVVKTAECRKVALYPDYNYCDTKWKAIDIYSIEGFENIVVNEGFQWAGS